VSQCFRLLLINREKMTFPSMKSSLRSFHCSLLCWGFQ